MYSENSCIGQVTASYVPASFRGLFSLCTLISARRQVAVREGGTGHGFVPVSLLQHSIFLKPSLHPSLTLSPLSKPLFSLSPALVSPFSPPVDSGHSEGAGVRP